MSEWDELEPHEKRYKLAVRTLARRLVFAAVLMAALVGGIRQCAEAGLLGDPNQDLKIRYRVTVTVETSEGRKTGSAVREAAKFYETRILPGQGGAFYQVLNGEAVIIDLGERGPLFLLLGMRGSQSEAEVVIRMFSMKSNPGKIIIEPSQYSDFAWFRNMADVTSIRNVVRAEDIAAVQKLHPYRSLLSFEDLGKGTNIKEVSIELTQDPVTRKIRSYLPWLTDKCRYITGARSTTGKEWYQQLTCYSFSESYPQ